MAESAPTTPKSKLNGLLAVISAFLFALLWSLDAFFFWTLLGITLYFGLRYLMGSGVSINFFNAPNSRSSPYRPNPSGTGNPARSPAVPSAVAKGFIRFIIIGVTALFFLLFLIGIFVSEDSGDEDNPAPLLMESDENQEALAWNDKGNAAVAGNNYDSAIFYYDKALSLDPGNQYALYNKSLVYTLRQEYRRSNSMARKCVALHPDYNQSYWLLGYNYDIMHMGDSALTFLETAYVNGFDETDFLELMAEVYLKKNDNEKAIEFYGLVIGKDSSRVTAYTRLAALDTKNAGWYRRKANELSR